MPADPEITIGSRVYRKNPAVDRYQIHLDELGELKMCDIPPHSHLEILGFPEPPGVVSMECYGVNGGSESEHEYLEVYGGASFKVAVHELSRVVSRLGRAFPKLGPDPDGYSRYPEVSTQIVDDGAIAHLFLNLKFKDTPDTFVRNAVAPFVDGYQRLERPSVRVFLCHATEDKQAAQELASAMTRLGAEIWFDEREIRVGDSIVQKIEDGLETVSHLIVLLSENSVNKPWVRKELSLALMRQLSQRAIKVLPFRLDDCTIPLILADIKYADGRAGMEHALAELEQALFSNETYSSA